MIPIRDAIRSKNFPAVNFIIIGLNIIVFLWQLAQGPHLKEALYLYGIVPLRYSDPALSAQFTTFQQYLPFLTSMFLHGGFLHIIMNMWFLYIFGDNIEDRLGHIRYLVFLSFLRCGGWSGPPLHELEFQYPYHWGERSYFRCHGSLSSPLSPFQNLHINSNLFLFPICRDPGLYLPRVLAFHPTIFCKPHPEECWRRCLLGPYRWFRRWSHFYKNI